MKYLLFWTFPVFVCGTPMLTTERSLVSGYLSTNYLQPQTVCCITSAAFDRPAFYKAMIGNDKELVNAQLKELNSAPSDIRDAFTGAMIMKKAGLGGSPVSKLHLFKEGHKMLESAIKEDPNNTEFRLLRLMIQENSPDFLGYKNDIEKDSEYIRKSYKSLPDEIQHTITEYNKKSKFLKLEVP